MKLSDLGLLFIKAYETLRLVAYMDLKNGTWTIAYGHTRGVKAGDTCTVEQANAWLAEEVLACEQTVMLEVTNPIEQHQFDALVSFVYNCGARAFHDSTLVKRVRAVLHDMAAVQFLRWNKSKNIVLRGLISRRGGEALMYAFADYTGR